MTTRLYICRLASLPLLAISLAAALCCSTVAVAGMDFDQLTALMVEQAQQAYDDNAHAVPAFLNELGYDQYRDFKYLPERRLWHEQNLPFEIEFFHPGYIYRKSVAMQVIGEDLLQTPFPFSPELFEYGPQQSLIARLPATLGFSGFLVWQRDAAGKPRHLGLFQGASYFRMVSSFDEYGLSARALAIDTNAGPEEFPGFTAFWLQQPAPTATELVFYGLADSPSVVAAYRFVLTPGKPIKMHVDARLVLRKPVKEIGLTPFSTMFWYAENSVHRPADFRPEVHDSDGVFIETAQEHIWRPLANPAHTRTDTLPGSLLTGFGLQQRDRDFEHYQDIEANYHRRPDAWITPGHSMQQGSLRLLEIESPHEYADNVALLWTPATMPQPGEIFAWDYDIYFGEHPAPPVAQVVATRYGESLRGDGSIEFVIDFSGGALPLLADDAEPQVVSEISGGEMIWQNIRKNPYNASWRLTLRVLPKENQDEMRLQALLKQDNQALSETWTYWWLADRRLLTSSAQR